ncbi:helix-turn-helix domain-containing protein [Stutzerimonas stutzeri]|uniref:helix-turn-helix domain-containing protein n=1 Tax=Stutzerimonas stutzeri TaxID=316 RepID=UPI00210D2244|nr:LysR family transcriptional regulator [Stutzerimonas stutzeri]MCQ4320841.1 LysR family transcriptional regulator [Stutzerimonas stutzeri]
MHNRLELVRIFCTAADSTNFREAATRLGISPQTVTRAIQQLESQLGEPLFHRNTRHNQVTAFGEAWRGNRAGPWPILITYLNARRRRPGWTFWVVSASPPPAPLGGVFCFAFCGLCSKNIPACRSSYGWRIN